MLDRFSYRANLAILVLAAAVFLAAPFLALEWAARPFPGFVVEPTLVVSGSPGQGWAGSEAGIKYPQRVIAIDGQPVEDGRGFDAALSALPFGSQIRVDTELPDGSTRHYSSIPLNTFPFRDLLRLFVLPYSIGLMYLAIGAWIFLVRGMTRPGRAFAVFCSSAAITSALTFDLTTTRLGPTLWTLAVAFSGGSLIRLALLFPDELPAIQRRVWLGYLPLGISLALAGWGVWSLRAAPDPWAYILPWRYSYVYLGIGILTLVAMMLYQQSRNPRPALRQGARIVLLGGLLAFTPIGVWAFSPFLGFSISWNPALFTPLLLFFPLSIGIAIIRYRLWDLDFVVNRTLVYLSVTAILVGLFFGSLFAIQWALSFMIGRPSSMAIAVSTLAIAALFSPLRNRIQCWIDQRFYPSTLDAAHTLEPFYASIRDEVDLGRLVARLEEVVEETIQPAHIFTWLQTSRGYSVYFPGGATPSLTYAGSEVPADDPLVSFLRNAPGAVQLDRLDLSSTAVERFRAGSVRLVAPMIHQGELVGWLSLGRRRNEKNYTLDERALISRLASQAAPAVQVALLVRRQQDEAIERERIEHELRLANRIQHSLLPKTLPDLPGWAIAVHYRPAHEVGGDFYDFIQFEDGRLGMFVGDVTGKGIPAALLMATTRSILRTVAQPDISPGEAMRQANNILAGDIPPAMFASCLYVVFDPNSGELQFANAGHNLPWLCWNGGAAGLDARGMPLGLLPDQLYLEESAHIQPGETLVFYTDGIIEAHNKDSEMFGEPRFQSLLMRDFKDGRELIDCSLAELAAFTGEGWEQEDDVTLVTLTRIQAIE